MTFTTYTEIEMTRIRIIQKLEDKVITVDQAGEALGKSERTIFRYLCHFRNLGPPGLVHGLRGLPSNNQIGKLEKYKKYAMKKKYIDFGPTLLAEELENELGRGSINPESLRLKMIQWGLRLPKKRNTKVQRQKRDRRPQTGMLIQFDGSYHNWLEDGKKRCFLLAIDDATSVLMLGIITGGETLKDMIIFWRKYFQKHGKPEAIYIDRHATYKVNHEQDQFDKEMVTRFQRAMRKLNVAVIYSYCPEGKGRIERSFKTHQDRMIKKMRLVGIKTVEEANEYIETLYIPEHNKKFAIPPKEAGDKHTIFTKKEQEKYERFFAKETLRKVRKDGTVRYNRKEYQIKKGEKLYNGRSVTVYEAEIGSVEIFSGKHKLVLIKTSNR